MMNLRLSHIVPLVVALAYPVGCARTKPARAPASKPATKAAEAPPVFSLATEESEQDDKNVVASRITKVTVYSDRALVTREASVPIRKEAVVHRFRHLPGWVDDGSVRASTSAGRIIDVNVERRFLARSTDAGFQRAEQRHKELVRKMQALNDELAILEARKTHIESIEAFSLEKLSTDAVMRDIQVSSYGDVVDFISDALRETAAARRKTEAAREQLAPEVEASARNLEELRRLTTLEETTVFVTLQGDSAGTAEVALTYATPGATWEPMHELRSAADNPGSVELTSFAVVTQTTGEDWNRAEMSFSTQSSSDPDHIPELEMLALGETEDRSRSVTRREASFSRAQQAYAEQNLHWNRMNQAPSKRRSEIERFEKSYTSNLEYFERVQSRTVQIFHGLEQRGTTAHFVAATAPIVRSDGRPIRVRIGSNRIKAAEKIVAAPEESLNAALTLQMTNNSPQALLPGTVGRYRDGAFLGMTDVDFVAQGEKFSLFFSVADQVKLTRKLDRKHSSLVRRARNRMQLSFVTTVE
ncbi:MAG: mucoidy inhibitor MuiA family protein, partial [Myxococcota bacterium]